MIYLDNSATTQVCDAAARAAMYGMQAHYFNPSSMYAPAAEVDGQIQTVRRRIAAAIGAGEDELFFTGCGTESNNIALLGTSSKLRPGRWRFVSTKMEHAAVYNVMNALERAGQEVVWLNLDSAGQINLQQLSSVVNERTALVSLMHVNNEFGAVADLNAIRETIKKRNPQTLLHSDGVQAFGKLPFSKVPVDLYSISAHKFYGPKGIGALMIRKGVANGGGLIGGGQEKGIRSGTLNTPGIYGMGAAFEQIYRQQNDLIAQIHGCKLRLASHLMRMNDVFVNGPSPENSAPQILNVSFMGVRGEVMLHALEERGIYVSTGSACSSKKKGPNRVLAAIGLPKERAESAIRFSFGPSNTAAEIDMVAETVFSLLQNLRRYKAR